jgi:hypothetical protein
MRDRSFVIKQREINNAIAKTVTAKKEEIQSRVLESVRQRLDEIEEKIKQLQEEKNDLLEGASTRWDVLEEAKTRLRANRKQVIECFLKPHLASCKQSNVAPFGGKSILPDWRAADVVWLSLNEQDVEEAINMLPETGIADEERKAKVEGIDIKISKLVQLLNEELEKIKT